VSSIIYNFEELGKACDKLSPSIRDKSMCSTCENVGWIMGADPRSGYPDRGYICPACKNRYCNSNPWPPGDAQQPEVDQPVPARFRKYKGDAQKVCSRPMPANAIPEEIVDAVRARRAKAQQPPRAMGSSKQVDDDEEIRFLREPKGLFNGCPRK